MPYFKTLAALFVFVMLCSTAVAQVQIQVLYEPVDLPAPDSAQGGKQAPVIKGTLKEPGTFALLSADGGKGPVIDMSKVVAITFPTMVKLGALKDKVKADKAALAALNQMTEKEKWTTANETLKKDQGDLDALQKSDEVTKKVQVEVVAQYKMGKFTGYFDVSDPTKSVKFLIETAATTPNAAPDPPEYYWPYALKAIYVIPPAPTPATPPAKTGQGAPGAAVSDAWVAVTESLGKLKKERLLLVEQHAQVERELQVLKNLLPPPPLVDPQSPPALRQESLTRVKIQLEAFLRAKDLTIEQVQLQLALLPLPPQDPKKPSVSDNYEAFLRTPCVWPVPACEEDVDLLATMAAKNHYGSLEERAARTHSKPFDSRFEQPAHFPLPRFGLYGERINTEGVVIYEGMRFVATRDGQYEVSFTTSFPAMPVTLRLQLVFARPENGAVFTLTLPPIEITPPTDFTGNYPGKSAQVYHAGYSRMIAEHFGDLCDMHLARQGTARFGSWPEGINHFEAPIRNPVMTQGSSGSMSTIAAPSP